MKAYLKFIILAIVSLVLVAECASATRSGDGGPRRGGCGGRGPGARKTTLASYNVAINPFFPGNGPAEDPADIQERTGLLIENVTVHLFCLV